MNRNMFGNSSVQSDLFPAVLSRVLSRVILDNHCDAEVERSSVSTPYYEYFGGPLWLFVVLALAPDISMLAYLAGPHVGSRLYNALHTYLAPVTLGAAGVWLGVTPFTRVALIWAAHIGVDRVIGYGLKHTHLSVEHNHNAPTDLSGRVVADAAGTEDN